VAAGNRILKCWRSHFAPRMLCGMSDVTHILAQMEQGDPAAAEQLLPLVYNELRKLAAAKLALEKPGQTLQATALVHEAYLRLVGGEEPPNWNGRSHFFRAAAEAMRRVLVDGARRKQGLKRGQGWERATLDDVPAPDSLPQEDLLSLSEALDKLAHADPQKAELVKLRFFAGLTLDEAAAALRISRATADRHWGYAKTWLYCELTRDSRQPE
jgi:RNA polymerase sigma factor (TIGR02999 family)